MPSMPLHPHPLPRPGRGWRPLRPCWPQLSRQVLFQMCLSPGRAGCSQDGSWPSPRRPVGALSRGGWTESQMPVKGPNLRLYEEKTPMGVAVAVTSLKRLLGAGQRGQGGTEPTSEPSRDSCPQARLWKAMTSFPPGGPPRRWSAGWEGAQAAETVANQSPCAHQRLGEFSRITLAFLHCGREQ